MSSPIDSGIGKKKRMQALKAAQAKEAGQKKEVSLGIGECDIGASPQMNKGAIFKKNVGGGGTSCPLAQAAHWRLGKRQK